MKVYEQIKDMLCDELEEIAKQKQLSSSTLDTLDEVVDIVKDINTIMAMEQEYGYSGNDGYSQSYYGRMPIYMYDDADMAREGRSYARGRGGMSRGRYASDGYSGDTKEELQHLMSTAKNDREREAIRAALDHMNR